MLFFLLICYDQNYEMLYISMLYMRFWISYYVQMISRPDLLLYQPNSLILLKKKWSSCWHFTCFQMGEACFTFNLWLENFPENLVSSHELAPIPLWRTDTFGETNCLCTPQEWSAQGNWNFLQRGLRPVPYLFNLISLCQGGKLESKIYENRGW